MTALTAITAGIRRTATAALVIASAWGGMSAAPVSAQVVIKPGVPTQGHLPPPPIDSGKPSTNPGSSGGTGALTPSLTVPAAPVPKVKPQVAVPAAPARAARAPKRLCEVAPGSNGCRGSAALDGGGSDDTSCNCQRDLCRVEQLPGQALARRYCYRANN